MATQVILLERVETLGSMGDVVAVKPGYARNYLLPQRKALRASKENIAYFEAQKKAFEAENDKKKKEAEKLSKNIEGLKVPLVRQASEAGQLYGSVTSRDIAEEVAAVSKQAVERSMVQLNQNFKSIGLFPVDIALHPEVKVSVTINIARSLEEAEIQAKTGKALVSDAADTAEEAPESEAGIDEDQLKDVLEEDALEAEKEKAEQEKVEAAEAEAKAQAKKDAKQAKAVEAEEADAESAADAEEVSDSSEEA